MQYTKHLAIRIQQRGKPQEVIEFIINHGKTINTHRDKKSFITTKIFNKLSLEREHIIFLKKYDKQLKSTAVIWNKNNQTVITAFTITKRINWSN